MTQENKTAVVTGASSGIGLEVAKTLLEKGFNVVANSRNISKSEAFESSPRLLLFDGDIGERETGRELIRQAVERFGSVDLLVNNAGIFISKPFVEYTPDDFSRIVSTNLTGFFNATQPALEQMKAQQSGHVVSISTSLVSQPLAGVPSAVPVLTKGGIDAATRALAIEHAGDNIRVNGVAAGIIDTPMHSPENHSFLETLSPSGRIGEAADITQAVLYLHEAGFVSGEIVHVDGGAHAGRW